MTTIAYKDGVLAADRRSNQHGAEVDKVWDGPEGIKYAGAGMLGKIHKVTDWLWSQHTEEPLDPPQLDDEDDWHVLEIHPDGTIFLYDFQLYPLRLKVPFHAIGSGSMYAMGAMASGASAVEAVLIASKFDPYTGNVVDAFKI